jgi:hypothetical protein
LTPRKKSSYSVGVRERNTILEQVGRGCPLVEDRIQVGIMRLVRELERPVSRSEMMEALGVNRNRVQPGAGHTNFARATEALRSVGFEGYMAMECGIRGDAREVLPEVVRHLRSMM